MTTTEGPLGEAEQRTLDARLTEGYTLDQRVSFMVMPVGLPRPRYRGMVVPYTVDLDWMGGAPRWKQNNALRRNLCVLDRRCGLCGERIDGDAAVMTTEPEVRSGAGVADRVALHATPCLAVTLANCPGLAHHADLVWWIVPVDDLIIGGTPGRPYFLQPDYPPTHGKEQP